MKKIINGRKYDTETADKIGEYSNGYSIRDFKYVEEYLYRKKNGEFFISGEGGPLTKYATHHGNSSGDGSRITPMTEDEAKEWAETHLDADDYIAIFGDPGED